MKAQQDTIFCVVFLYQVRMVISDFWSQKGGKVSAYTIRSGNVTLNTKAGCVQSKQTSGKHCVNGVTGQLTSQVWARAR